MRDSVGPVMVFEPSPLLTVTIEQVGDADDVHVHAGGQGAWIARMLAALDVPFTVCCPIGGETGVVVRALLESQGIRIRSVELDGATAAYVHDRRSGERREVAEAASPELSRHDLDELYNAALAVGMESEICVLAGSRGGAVPADTYRRLASDLQGTGSTVVADLSGEELRAGLAGGLDVVKVSDSELVDGGWLAEPSEDNLLAVLAELARAGAENVVVSRSDQPAFALVGGEALKVVVPRLDELDHRGAGDSMTAGISGGLARGLSLHDALRLGAAAGALNVTRHGLASGNGEAIEALAARVELERIEAVGRSAERRETATPEELAARARPRS